MCTALLGHAGAAKTRGRDTQLFELPGRSAAHRLNRPGCLLARDAWPLPVSRKQDGHSPLLPCAANLLGVSDKGL